MTLLLRSQGELADGGQLCWVAGRQLKLHSGCTHNHENEGKTHNCECMLYSVYAVLGVNS